MEQKFAGNTLTGKRVIILGGSSGLGLATAQTAAAEGAEVAIVSSNQNRIDTALQSLPGKHKGFAVDLSKEGSIRNFFENAGTFDHLVYTAGEPITMSHVQDTDISQARDFFTIRYWGAFAAVKYAVPTLSKDGSITLMSGSFGQRPAKGYSLGATMCGAMDAFTRALALELAPIRVNNIAAGVIKTNLWNGLSKNDREGFYQHLENTLPLGRVGEAGDIAAAFIYLMKQQYTTGQSLVIDGGSVLV